MQASTSVFLAHTDIRIFYLFLSPPIRALNTIRVSLTGSKALELTALRRKEDRVFGLLPLDGTKDRDLYSTVFPCPIGP